MNSDSSKYDQNKYLETEQLNTKLLFHKVVQFVDFAKFRLRSLGQSWLVGHPFAILNYYHFQQSTSSLTLNEANMLQYNESSHKSLTIWGIQCNWTRPRLISLKKYFWLLNVGNLLEIVNHENEKRL